MNKRSDRAAFILGYLQDCYPQPPIPLKHRDPFTLLVAVLLSAQCTDARVNKVTPSLFELADNPTDMAQLSLSEVYDLIRSCGLAPQKSKAIISLSKILVDQYRAQVPSQLEALKSLPGVGHKTASVVMAQAFNQPAFPVDTHIHRLAQRWRLTDGRNVRQTEADLKRAFAEEFWIRLHLQIIYYGRDYCGARTCYGLTCPICSQVNKGRVRPIKTRSA